MTIGQGVSYWQFGWRFGFLQSMEGTGRHKGDYQIKNPVTGLVWVPASCVNEAGDTAFHGVSAVEIYEERKEEKKKEQAAVDKRKAVRRFHR